MYSIGLALIGLAQIVHSAQFGFWDWPTFAFAAAHAGTPGLLQPRALEDAFVYLPGAAWAFAPLRDAPLAVGFSVNAVLMLGAVVAAAFTARRIYALSVPIALALILAWAPTTYAFVIGQNGPIGLLLVLLSLLGFVRGGVALTAVPLVLLLYKPTFALPLIGLLLLRRRARELAVVALGAVGWYLASVAATGGDWAWPNTLARLEHAFFALDFAHNHVKAIGLTTILLRFGIPNAAVAVIAALVVAASIPLLLRAPDREAYAAASLLGLVVSPHAWGYDGILALPMIFLAVTTVREPERTWLVCAAYALAPFLIFSHEIGFDPLAIVVIGGFIAWYAVRSKARKPGMA